MLNRTGQSINPQGASYCAPTRICATDYRPLGLAIQPVTHIILLAAVRGEAIHS